MSYCQKALIWNCCWLRKLSDAQFLDECFFVENLNDVRGVKTHFLNFSSIELHRTDMLIKTQYRYIHNTPVLQVVSVFEFLFFFLLLCLIVLCSSKKASSETTSKNRDWWNFTFLGILCFSYSGRPNDKERRCESNNNFNRKSTDPYHQWNSRMHFRG